MIARLAPGTLCWASNSFTALTLSGPSSGGASAGRAKPRAGHAAARSPPSAPRRSICTMEEPLLGMIDQSSESMRQHSGERGKTMERGVDVIIVVDMQVGLLDGATKHDLPGVIGRINALTAKVRHDGGKVI